MHDERLREDLTKRLPWLFDELGFRITDIEYSYKHMGAWTVAMVSDSLRLSIRYDGFGYWFEVAPPTCDDPGVELGWLWHLLKNHRPTPQIEGWAWFFREHFVEVKQAVGRDWEKTKQRRTQAQEESRKYLENRHRPTDWFSRYFTPLGILWVRQITRYGFVILIAWILWKLFELN